VRDDFAHVAATLATTENGADLKIEAVAALFLILFLVFSELSLK